MASQLTSSALVTREGPVHVSIGRGNAGIETAVKRYLVDPEHPPEPVTCR